MDKYRVYAPRAAFAVVTGALLISAAYIYTLRTNVASLSATAQEQKIQLAQGAKLHEVDARAVADFQNRLTASDAQCTASTGQLKSAIDAFAKQAASCEEVKRKFSTLEKS